MLQQQQGYDQGFDQAILGDAGEALGRLGTGDGAGSPGGGGKGGVAVPIHFKELVVLARRGNDAMILCMMCEIMRIVCACVFAKTTKVCA